MTRCHPFLAQAIGKTKRGLLSRAPASTLQGSTLLVACSGGADSVAALGLLERLQASLRLKVVVGHIDHGLRASSRQEAIDLEAIARGLELEFFSTRLDLARGSSLANRARLERRRALLTQAEQAGARGIVLAHSATDQAESMLMHLARGAGLVGIQAMSSWEASAALDMETSTPSMSDPIALFRPVLEFTRRELRELAGLLDLPFFDDPTNLDHKHFRVAVREEVLPCLRHFNPQVEQALLSASAQARDAEEALEIWGGREFSERRCPPLRGESSAPRWNLHDFHRLPRAIRTRVLRSICLALGADPSALGYAQIAAMEQAAMQLAEAQSSPHEAPAGGVRPRSWDLRPACTVKIDKNGITRTAKGESVASFS